MNPLVQAYDYACARINTLGDLYEYEAAHQSREPVLDTLAAFQSAIVEEWVLDPEMREQLY